MRSRPSFLLVAALALAAALPSTALATGPALQPKLIRTQGFEDPGFTDPVTGVTMGKVDMINYERGALAWWGRVTNRAKSGSYGLWCAGSRPGGPVTLASVYPTATAGLAWIPFSETAGYYATRLDFSYTMPSLGSADRTAFNVQWYDASSPSNLDAHVQGALTAKGAWVTKQYWLSNPANVVNLSRTAGGVRLQFVDDPSDLGSSATSEGVTVDDVSISGYMFGPPRNVTVTAATGKNVIFWNTPLSSTRPGAGVETRPLVYRVWRTTLGSANWVELPLGASAATHRLGLAGPSIDDTSAVAGTRYAYAVQAWTPAVEVDEWGVRSALPSSTSLRLLTSATPSYNATSTFSATLKDAIAGTYLTSKPVIVQKSTDNRTWVNWQTIYSGTGSFTFISKPFSLTYYRLKFVGDSDNSASYSASVKVTPKAYLSTPYAPATAYKGRAFTSYGYLKPWHKPGTYPVTLYAYRYESTKWVLRKTVKAIASDYSTYTRYSIRFYLPYAGKWRVRAYHHDGGHAATYSYYKTFTVK